MTLIIEDGSIVPNANSYVTVAEYQDWADARFGPNRETASQCDADVEAIILRAMDYFEGQIFQGTKVQRDQPLQWPRINVVIDGFYVPSDSIPIEVKNAIFELAYADELGNSELATVDRAVKKEKVASIEVEYMDNASSRAVNVGVSNSLKKLLRYGGAMRVVRV